jgi:hypothetical protein
MADYYPLIARAVAGLEKNTGEGRRVVYERARQALVTQLRSLTPALSESDVTRERLALEEAIRKVEAESARRSTLRSDPAAKVRPPEFPRWEEPEPASKPEPPPAPLPPRRARAEGRQATAAERSRSEARRSDAIDGETPAPEAPAPLPPRRAAPVSRPDGRQATAVSVRPRSEASPIAQDEEPLPAPESPEPMRPGKLRGASERAPGEPAAAERGVGEARGAGERPPPERGAVLNSGLQDFREAVSEADELGVASARASQSARDQFAAVPTAASEPRPQPRAPDSDDTFPVIEDAPEQEMLEPTFVVDEGRPVPPRTRQPPRQAPPVEIDRKAARRTLALVDMIGIVGAVVLLGGILAAVIWLWPNIVGTYRSLWSPAPEVAKEASAPVSKPKIADRIEPGGAPSQAAVSPEAPAVAQRVVLYEEDPNDPQGKRSAGSVVWRTDTISPGPGRPPELAVRGDVEIPERKISMTWTLRRDTDQNRSTSHTIEIMFKLPPDYPSGGIFNVPGIWMKQAEQTQGTALAGLAVKVTTGYFLIGLSAAPADRERNIQLLKDREWFDVAIVYNNNKRAILTMEKGTPGARAFAEAFAAWEK